jgi:hypothetical protein
MIVGTNLKHEEIEALATPRTLEGIATLSPGVTENATNSRQMVVNRAMAFDNIFMINGVDVNDNLFAQPQNLFIEDAIEETQVLTAGIFRGVRALHRRRAPAVRLADGRCLSPSASSLEEETAEFHL